MTSPRIPADIQPLVLKLEGTKRFVNTHYPKHLFSDNVLQHTLRCVSLAVNLAPIFSEPGFPINLELLQRILWMHDVVEIGMTADVPAPDKAIDPALAAKTESCEFQKAKTLMNASDFYLLQQFEIAKGILSGQHLHQEVLVEAIVARIIDVLDGNIQFNRSLVRWLKQHDHLDLPAFSLTYAFTTNRQYFDIINKHQSWGCLVPLMEAETTYVKSLWQAVDAARIPQVLKPLLAN